MFQLGTGKCLGWRKERKTCYGIGSTALFGKIDGLKNTQLATKVRVLISNLETSTDLEGLVKASGITVLSVSWHKDKDWLCPNCLMYYNTTLTFQKVL